MPTQSATVRLCRHPRLAVDLKVDSVTPRVIATQKVKFYLDAEGIVRGGISVSVLFQVATSAAIPLRSVRDSPRALTGEHPSTHRTNSVPVLPEQAAWIAVFQGFFKHAPLRVTSGKLV